MKRLVIVESPAKARTLNKYLGKEYVVKASMGHVRDLPKNRLGVDVEHSFTPTYLVIKGKEKVLKELKRVAKDVEEIYLASDPDREGEAIAWHIAQEMKKRKDRIRRVLFYEITKRAVQKAIENPSTIDLNKVNAQQARRILDRLVGYSLSPLLWKKVERGLSAGRVQSVVVRLICEREREIEQFVPKEYWTITAHLQKMRTPSLFPARLVKVDGKRAEIRSEEEARSILASLKGASFQVVKAERREKREFTNPPFTTSTLQQEAARKLGFTAKKTMLIAQQLYEGIEVGEEGPAGLITYMRSDSVRVSKETQEEARDVIRGIWGEDFLPLKPPHYKSKKGAQEAHEAIRPTVIARTPGSLQAFLPPDHLKLYRLIWERFIASQMVPALFDVTTVDIKGGNCLFRATGKVLKFSGYRVVYVEDRNTSEKEAAISLPPLEKGDDLECLKIEPKQHFTQPTSRFTEATLVKALEDKGIGRPSTYATIISTVQERGYVERRGKHLFPTILGIKVNELLVEFFPRILDVGFTAKMEESLDEIEEGKRDWVETLRDFYFPFSEELGQAERHMGRVKKSGRITELVCELCGKPMVERWSKHGRFLGCSGYPECKNVIPLDSTLGVGQKKRGEPPGEDLPCPSEECKGHLVRRQGRRGNFYGCSNYPSCRFTTSKELVHEACSYCGFSYLLKDKKRVITCPRCGKEN